jgi:hypothetical protein
MVLEKMFVCKNDNVTKERKKLYNEDLYIYIYIYIYIYRSVIVWLNKEVFNGKFEHLLRILKYKDILVWNYVE